MGKLAIIKTLLTHRVTYRFLFVLGSAIGITSGMEHVSELETIICTILACSG